jgi:hypothetical protein
MKTKLLFLGIASGLFISVQGQKPTLDMILTAMENDSCTKMEGNYTTSLAMDSDTILLLDYAVEIAETSRQGADIKTTPNSRPGQVLTTISMYVPETDFVCIKITDMQGRTIINSRRLLEKGTHAFTYTPGGGEVSVFTAFWHGRKNSIQIPHEPGMSSQKISLEYLGSYQVQSGVNSKLQVPGSNKSDKELYSGKEKGL